MSGRSERAEAEIARLRRPNVRAYYGQSLPDVEPGAFDFRTVLIRPGFKPVDISRLVSSVSWEDSDAVLAGTLTVERPDADDPGSMPVGWGHSIRLDTRPQQGGDKHASGWVKLWTMKARPAAITVGTDASVELEDDLAVLREGKEDYSYRKTAARKRGWYAHEIAADVARRLGLPVGKLAKGTKRITLKRKDATPLQILRAAYKAERDHSGRKFIIRLDAGRLVVVELERNNVLYRFRKQIEDASIEQSMKAHPVTVLKARGTIGKGKEAKKVKHTEFRRKIVQRFGRVEDSKDFGKVDSLADLREQTQKELAKQIKVVRNATLTCPGSVGSPRRRLPVGDVRAGVVGGLRRGYGQIVRVRCVRVARGQQRRLLMTLELTQTDPYAKDSVRQAREARRRARERRGQEEEGGVSTDVELLAVRRAFPEAQAWLAQFQPDESLGIVTVGWHSTATQPDDGPRLS